MRRFVVTALLAGLSSGSGTAAEAEGRPPEKEQKPQRVGDAYPLAVCPVSGKKLGSMGEPIDFVHENRLVRLCCRGCIPEFDKDPGTFSAKLDAGLNKKDGKRDAGEPESPQHPEGSHGQGQQQGSRPQGGCCAG